MSLKLETSAGPERAEPPAQNIRLIYLILSAAGMFYGILQSTPVPAFTAISTSMHTSQNTVTWLITGYLLSSAVATPIMGRVGDLLGNRFILIVALVFLFSGAVISAVAANMSVMIIGRVVQGVGGGIVPLSFGIIRDSFPPARVAPAIGMVAGITSCGVAVGTVIAGPLVTLLGYRAVFWVPLILVGLITITAWFVVPATPPRATGGISVLPAILLTGTLVTLLVGVSKSSSWGWTSPSVLGLVILSAVLLPAWIASENRAAHPLIDMRMMRIPAIAAGNMVAFFSGAAILASFAFAPALLEAPKSTGYGAGVDITVAGLLLAPQSLISLGASGAGGSLLGRYGGRRLILSGMLTMILPFVCLACFHDAVWKEVVALTVLGVGVGGLYSVVANVIVATAPREHIGVAAGMNANLRTIGGAIGTAIMATIVTSHVGPNGFPIEAGYTNAYWTLTGFTVAAAIAAIFLPRRVPVADKHSIHTVPHPELGIVAGGTLVSGDPE